MVEDFLWVDLDACIFSIVYNITRTRDYLHVLTLLEDHPHLTLEAYLYAPFTVGFDDEEHVALLK